MAVSPIWPEVSDTVVGPQKVDIREPQRKARENSFQECVRKFSAAYRLGNSRPPVASVSCADASNRYLQRLGAPVATHSLRWPARLWHTNGCCQIRCSR